MKKFMKKTLAVLLAIVMISATFVSFAAELNKDAVDAHYGQYKNYVLLGDSVAIVMKSQKTTSCSTKLTTIQPTQDTPDHMPTCLLTQLLKTAQ